MLARSGFARLLPLLAFTGLTAGTVALLACERPEPRPPAPVPRLIAVPYDGGCSDAPAPVPSHGVRDASGRLFSIDVRQRPTTDPDLAWEVNVRTGRESGYGGHGPTREIAICEAALFLASNQARSWRSRND
jgi:hypothetical protein